MENSPGADFEVWFYDGECTTCDPKLRPNPGAHQQSQCDVVCALCLAPYRSLV